MIAVENVHKWYGRLHALRGVSFELRPGQVAGLLGPNGAGKSTTIRILAGIMPPDAGRATIAGHDTLGDSIRARASLGYLPESAPLYPEMSVRDFLAYRAALSRVERRTRRGAIDRAVERCWLAEVRTRPIGQLSKGYRQRVGLAAAILHDPRVLILDEPTNGLDPSQIAQMRGLVHELGADRTMLISSHILPEIEQICSRILIVAGGTLRADGSPEALVRAHGDPARVVVEAAAAPDAARSLVARSMGVPEAGVSVERLDGRWSRAIATVSALAIGSGGARDGVDPRESIAAACARDGIALRELRLARSTVEDVFMKLSRAEVREVPA
jgi:ABC-2 type transport system ATP-binding protein